MAKSYFAILGVSPNSTAEEVKSAYRRLAKSYHPDRYAGDSKRFRQIQEAYAVLSTAYTRRRYEQTLAKAVTTAVSPTTAHTGPEPLIPEQRPEAAAPPTPLRPMNRLSPVADKLSGWHWSKISSPPQPQPARECKLRCEVRLAPHQARRGGNLKIIVPVRAVCPSCQGLGMIGFYECRRCSGERSVACDLPILVAFPPGIERGHCLRIPLDRYGIGHTHLTLHFRPVD